MTRAKSGAAKTLRPARSMHASHTAERREAVARAVDEIVDDTVDDLVERSSGAPERSFEASNDPQRAGRPAPHKLVRASFEITKDDYRTIDLSKTRLLRLSHSAERSELLRAGAATLARMSDGELLAAIAVVPSLKTGRPKSGGGENDGSRKKGASAR